MLQVQVVPASTLLSDVSGGSVGAGVLLQTQSPQVPFLLAEIASWW